MYYNYSIASCDVYTCTVFTSADSDLDKIPSVVGETNSTLSVRLKVALCVSSFVMCRVPPQVIKKENIFECGLRLLVAPALRLQSALQLQASLIRCVDGSLQVDK